MRVEGPRPKATDARIALDDAGRIAQDIPCRACGYNIRGLEPTALCPECSTPVERSILGDLLRFCDPRWLDRLASGVRLVIIGTLGGVVVAVGLTVVLVALAAGGTVALTTTVSIGASVSAAVTLITVIGVWLATTPDPGDDGTAAGSVGPRRLARWCVLADVAAAPLQMATSASGTIGAAGPGMAMPGLTGLAVVGTGLGLVALIGKAAALAYFGALAGRIPRVRLARQSRTVAWGYAVCRGLGLVIGLVLAPMIGRMGPTPGAASGGILIVGGIASCAVAVGSLIFGVWALVLLFVHAGAFRRVAAESRSAWAAGVSG